MRGSHSGEPTSICIGTCVGWCGYALPAAQRRRVRGAHRCLTPDGVRLSARSWWPHSTPSSDVAAACDVAVIARLQVSRSPSGDRCFWASCLQTGGSRLAVRWAWSWRISKLRAPTGCVLFGDFAVSRQSTSGGAGRVQTWLSTRPTPAGGALKRLRVGSAGRGRMRWFADARFPRSERRRTRRGAGCARGEARSFPGAPACGRAHCAGVLVDRDRDATDIGYARQHRDSVVAYSRRQLG